MTTSKKYNYLFKWIEKQQSVGKYVFNLEQLIKEFPDQSESGILLALKRLAKKKRVVSVYKGFYLIVPPEYAARGILPPITFIDDLMSFIGKPYYVGLLSAAALHGAAHQQPQEFFVVTSTKQLTTRKKGIKINYFTRGTIPEILVEKRKTEAGYVNVSSAELTAADLVYYHNRIGGLNRVCTVINELAESISPKKINKDLIESMSTPTIQRLGIIFEKYVNRPDLGQELLEVTQSKKRKFYIQPFKAGGEKKGFEIDEKWKIIINTTIDIEE
ncbi:MAG TPA: type IV toxin-antitoxin system AbiEi family antitoxin [Candidatus Cloacimonadota bacterium]|nr:type IV toxin-antitoxin system AbiEi family antitoxin [Bacteroidales bacterium]HPM02150.1 type IV toxin-antitoxin system AbiEi family antitoxin [Candidatus Cloacimonadota bacterium]